MTTAGGDLADLAAQVMTHANEGRLDEAAALVSAHGEQAVAALDAGSACFWYAAAVVEHVRGDLVAQVRAADLCLRSARAAGSAGWASNALSMRGMAHARSGAVDAALSDLARAEIELDACDDPGLRGWAATGLGYCYDHLRLYELAEPHFRDAVGSAGVGPMPLPESSVIDLRNLAELHHSWADELERVVPRHASADDVAAHRDRSRHWAQEAVRDAQRRGLSSWDRSSRRMHLCAAAALQPHLVIAELRRELDQLGPTAQPGDRVRLATALARALAAVGRLDEALAQARAAVPMLDEPVDWQVEVSVRHLVVQLEAQAGLPGAVNGLAYAELLSQALWQQRLRTLQGARTALEVERLQVDHAQATLAAQQDPLTRLGNRRALDSAITGLVHASSERRQHSLVLLDVDSFKSVNDEHGHVVGDSVLVAVADALRASARDDDVLVRLGGDEFVVLAPGAGPEAGAELARRLDHAIVSTDWSVIATGLQVTATLGVASTGHGRGVLDLVGAADERMYGARGARRRPSSEPG
ncbi:MAG TPA: GGDEF domain-containing protein [Actinomycetales bacterium]